MLRRRPQIKGRGDKTASASREKERTLEVEKGKKGESFACIVGKGRRLPTRINRKTGKSCRNHEEVIKKEGVGGWGNGVSQCNTDFCCGGS